MSGRLLLLMAMALVVGFAPAPLPRTRRAEPVKDDLQKMQGLWEVVKYERAGSDLVPQINAKVCYRIEGKRMTSVVDGNDGPYWNLELSPSSSPRALDKTLCLDSSFVTKAVYRFEGRDLVICQENGDGVRPTDFDSQQDRSLIVLKRR
jgi:uncharacterized protein (TIGR03067 family)